MNTNIFSHLIYTSTGSYRYFCSKDIQQDTIRECSDLAGTLLKNISPPAHCWWQHTIAGDLVTIGLSEKSVETGRPTEHFHCIIIRLQDYCALNLQSGWIAQFQIFSKIRY